MPSLFCLILAAGLGIAFGQKLDISSGGAPTITGAVGGSVTGSSSVLNDLVVTINFGEVSPSNTSGIVKVVVPIALRSDQDYKVQATVTGGTNANAQAVQQTDIGFGINNFHSMGANGRVCTNSSHLIYSPFNNDPSSNVTIAANGRAAYPSTLSNVTGSTTLVSGPILSLGDKKRKTDDGYIFDAIFAITPQFYDAGVTSATITFTISAGLNVPC